MIKSKNLFNYRVVSFYGYSYTKLPIEIEKLKNRRINVFFKDNQLNKLENSDLYNLNSYFGYKGISYGEGDIVFLDQNAVKSLCIGYPSNSKFVLISIRNIKFYIYILIGILRRRLNKSIKIKGFIYLSIENKKVPWILLENIREKTNSYNFCSKVGVKGLLDYLLNEKINYLVPRFYRSLPKLSTKESDLDLLVYKNDALKVTQFIEANPGSIGVDIYTDIGLDYYGMPYFPPHKAREILKRSIAGPGNSKVPNANDSLLLLIYHILYHKGFLSGLPSILGCKEINLDNKYYKEISKLKRDLNIKIGDTLEELDDYMFDNGWRPAIDTLTKISEWNEWVYRYHIKKEISRTPLYVLMLKNICIGTKKEKILIKECFNQKLKIIEQRVLNGPLKDRATKEIRGGVWNDSLDSNMDQLDYYPGKIFVIWDSIGLRVGGFSNVKEVLRKKIDKFGPSLIHSSDNYEESLDYINICMPDRYFYYKDENLINSHFSRYNIKNLNFTQLIPKIKSSIRLSLIKMLSH